MPDRTTAIENVLRALAELEDYAALPIANRRDKAGLIQGFEFTFELFWKLFMKLGPAAGIQPTSPREALMAGAQLRLIEVAEQSDWTRMLLDRNQTSHTYNADLADEILGRILGAYLPCFRLTLARIRAANGA
jgi:nucleotidyltransferase substrate binding protein (TIGR01987 family)